MTEFVLIIWINSHKKAAVTTQVFKSEATCIAAMDRLHRTRELEAVCVKR